MNNDPYKILGVSPDASEADIKSAYKELVKKYHPDQYQDNPLKDVAAEKMAEINAAYDQIITSRRNGSSSSYSGSAGTSSSFNNNQVRYMIQTGNITAADEILDGVSPDYRDAEWYYLKGSVCYKRGWLNDAMTNFNRAVQLNPSNAEYQSALNMLNRQRGGYMNGNPNGAYQNNAASGMDCCSQLCIADCCCEMLGGDLIPCC